MLILKEIKVLRKVLSAILDVDKLVQRGHRIFFKSLYMKADKTQTLSIIAFIFVFLLINYIAIKIYHDKHLGITQNKSLFFMALVFNIIPLMDKLKTSLALAFSHFIAII